MVFPAEINLANLNGTNGFVLNGIDSENYSGISVSDAGDVNGDGIDDIIIGANYADPNGNSYAGESYVVFGIADNTALNALNDSFTTNESTPLVAIDVLGNDADADGDTLSITVFDTTATTGIVTDNGDGTFDINGFDGDDFINAKGGYNKL